MNTLFNVYRDYAITRIDMEERMQLQDALKAITVRIPESDLNALTNLSNELGRSRNDVVVELLGAAIADAVDGYSSIFQERDALAKSLRMSPEEAFQEKPTDLTLAEEKSS